MGGRSHAIDVDISEPGDGVLAAIGGRWGGFSLFVKGGKPAYCHNLVMENITCIVANSTLPDDGAKLRFEFKKTGLHPGGGAEGDIMLIMDGKTVAEGRLDRFTPGMFSVP